MKDNLEEPQYLTFHIGGDEYAFGILKVREIIEYGTVTKVPTMPDFVRGVINLRGSVVPVVDLAVKLGLPKSTVNRWSCIVVTEVILDGEEIILGVLVDSMGQVVQLSPKDIEKPPAFGTRVRIDCLEGMGKLNDKFVMILDIDRLLGHPDVLSVSSAAQAPEEPSLPPEPETGEATAR